jgi:hypothetical protein
VDVLNAIMGLAVLGLLGVLMIGLNRQAREERKRLERRPAPRPVPTMAVQTHDAPVLAEEPLPEPAADELAYDGRDDGVDGVDGEREARPVRRRRRRRRTGSSGDALEELMDL